MNGELYPAAVYILQVARAHNVTVPGGRRYNVPSGNITNPISPDDVPPPGLTSYSVAAISGADDFGDSRTTIRDIFDLIVGVTREVSPTCEFPVVNSHLFNLLTRSRIKSEHNGFPSTCGRNTRRKESNSSRFSFFASQWPVRSVERLPQYSPLKLKNRVLVIGNTVGVPCPRTEIIPQPDRRSTVHRPTRSRRLRMRGVPPPCSVKMLSCSSNSDSVTRLLLKTLLAPGAL